MDLEKDLDVYAIIDQSYYDVKIYLNSESKSFKELTITRNQIYYLQRSNLSVVCSRNTLYRVIVEATFTKNIYTKPPTEEPKIEITVRQIKNTPSYLQKNQVKNDFTYGDNYYYLYIDLGKK